MVDALRMDVANLVGLIMQAFFYGVYQVLFLGCLYVLFYRRVSPHLNWTMLTTSFVMWLLITLNFAISWSRITEAFIAGQPALREDPEALTKFLGNMGNWKEVARTGAYLSLTVVADGLLIYRCYVIWSRNKYIIILPVSLLCGSVISAINIEIVLSVTGARTSLFALSLASWSTSFFSISLTQNVITTFLIVYRIWRISMNVARLERNHTLRRVMAVILESGAIYSSMLLVLLMVYATGTFAVYIAVDMLVPTIGIVFSLIIVRVGLGLSQTSAGRGASSTTLELSAVRFRSVVKSVDGNVSRHVTAHESISIKADPMSTGMGDRDKRDDISAISDHAWKSPAEVV